MCATNLECSMGRPAAVPAQATSTVPISTPFEVKCVNCRASRRKKCSGASPGDSFTTATPSRCRTLANACSGHFAPGSRTTMQPVGQFILAVKVVIEWRFALLNHAILLRRLRFARSDDANMARLASECRQDQHWLSQDAVKDRGCLSQGVGFRSQFRRFIENTEDSDPALWPLDGLSLGWDLMFLH